MQRPQVKKTLESWKATEARLSAALSTHDLTELQQAVSAAKRAQLQTEVLDQACELLQADSVRELVVAMRSRDVAAAHASFPGRWRGSSFVPLVPPLFGS